MRNFYDFDMVPLGTEGLDISAFDCNCDEVNSFFQDEATAYQDELFGKSYFLCNPEDWSDVAAGFTVANASIFTKRLPNSRRKKVGKEVHHEKGMINYPAVLLAQLGVDKRYKGCHLGAQIIDFVADWFTNDDNKSGCRHLIVDAYDNPKLLEFYQSNGLQMFFSTVEQEMEYRNWSVETDGNLRTRLMYKDMILLKRKSIR